MKPQPLLRRTELLPGETLVSLLQRLACLNYYPSWRTFNWLYRHCGNHPINYYDLARPYQAQAFSFLSQLTGLEPDALFLATIHRFAPVLTIPRQDVASMAWLDGEPRQVATKTMNQRQLRSVFEGQFCPQCLQESPYHRSSWLPVASAICLQHQCLLLNRCPECSKKVSAIEIVNRFCWTCQANLSQGPSLSVADDALGLLSQQVIQSWLSNEPVSFADPTWPQQPPNLTYHLLDRLRKSLISCSDDWPNLSKPLAELAEQFPERPHPMKKMSPRQAYYLYRTAFSGLLDWPHGLADFLDAYGQRNSKSRTASSLTRRLGLLGNWLHRTRQHPEFEFVQRGLVAHLVKADAPLPYPILRRYKSLPWFIEQTGLCSPHWTAQVLGISHQTLQRLFSAGALRQCLWPQSKPEEPIFERDKVLEVKQQWETGLSLKQASRWLGLSEKQVVELVQQDMLTVKRGQDSLNHADWGLDWQSVDALFETVVNRLEPRQRKHRTLIDLTWAAFLTASLEVDSAALLKGVIDGLFPGYKIKPRPRRLNKVFFPDAMIFSQVDLIYEGRGWIRAATFARQKGLDEPVIEAWVKAGLIEPLLNSSFDTVFRAQEIERFAAERLPGG